MHLQLTSFKMSSSIVEIFNLFLFVCIHDLAYYIFYIYNKSIIRFNIYNKVVIFGGSWKAQILSRNMLSNFLRYLLVDQYLCLHPQNIKTLHMWNLKNTYNVFKECCSWKRDMINWLSYSITCYMMNKIYYCDVLLGLPFLS